MRVFVGLRRHSGRSGASLIECILFMFLLSTIGVLGFQVLGRLLRIDAAGTHLEDAQRQRNRLERTWRDDVHRAEQIIRPAMDGASDDVELQVEGTRILYAASDEGSVTRRVLRDETPVAVERWDVDGSLRFRRSREGRLLAMELDAPRMEIPSGSGAPTGAARPDLLQTNVIEASVGTSRPQPGSLPSNPAPEMTP